MDKLLSRSAEYEDFVYGLLSYPEAEPSSRTHGAKILCAVAMEHGQSLKILMHSHAFTSALGLLRLQYEALVRAHWLVFAASDTQVEKLLAELTHESAKAGNSIPMVGEMMKAMEGKAPPNALQPLQEFKENSYKALSSYIHGGIHAISRKSKGYPIPLLENVLKNSNQLCGVSCYFWAQMTKNPLLMAQAMHSFNKYQDCFNYLPNSN
ncbi:hypothetical protein MJ923_05745 [Shewanella sp. 3B26]|uniref:Uncharacterized protein n=1 Tax=Shewanella zhuhaiensis TaxID=2919576 RepID=A0AAJ1BFR0_9GAMM|nr:hypothetical protein [Shewanella zhuhaiensis]MCH4293805.1 hypothetical protein [Shewanella zhuhaiensis]